MGLFRYLLFAALIMHTGWAQDSIPPPPAGAQGEFAYNPTNKRDPFKPPLQLEDMTEATLPAIQRYTLDQLRLTTILWVNPDSGDASKAMFKDPKDRNYILREGDKIGKNNGVILRIGKGEVTVVEKYKDPFGNESIKETPVLPMSSRATQ